MGATQNYHFGTEHGDSAGLLNAINAQVQVQLPQIDGGGRNLQLVLTLQERK